MSRRGGLFKFLGTTSRSSTVRGLVKIAKAANQLNKGVSSLSGALEEHAVASRPRYPNRPSNEAFDAFIKTKHGDLVIKSFHKRLVGVTYLNSDGSSRQSQIERLRPYQELRLLREPENKFDPNAILVVAPNGKGLGYLDERLAGEVTRSLNKGFIWHCYSTRLLKAPGAKNYGLTVCLVKLRKQLAPTAKRISAPKYVEPRRSIFSRFVAFMQPKRGS